MCQNLYKHFMSHWIRHTYMQLVQCLHFHHLHEQKWTTHVKKFSVELAMTYFIDYCRKYMFSRYAPLHLAWILQPDLSSSLSQLNYLTYFHYIFAYQNCCVLIFHLHCLSLDDVQISSFGYNLPIKSIGFSYTRVTTNCPQLHLEGF